MPELPEVETIVRGLEGKIVGRKINAFEGLLPKSVWLDEVRATGSEEVSQIKSLLEGKTITSITRRAKMIIVGLSDNVGLLAHLKMTGQLIFVDANKQRFSGGHPTGDMSRDMPVKSTRAIFSFDDGSELYFNDQRQFGYLKVIPLSSLEEQTVYKRYGPEPFDPDFHAAYMQSIAKRRPKSRIKQLLLDQEVVAGIGNIYADESLFISKIHPATRGISLSISDFERLITAVQEILLFSISRNGTSSEHYVTSTGEKGDMQNFLKVYRKTGEACVVCGSAIERTVVAGRGTHYCPNCQPLYKHDVS